MTCPVVICQLMYEQVKLLVHLELAYRIEFFFEFFF